MEDLHLYTFLSLVFLFIAFKFLFRTRTNLPPSPFGFPILGHLHLLKDPVHRTLHKISETLGGPVFSLRLGNRLVVVVSSSAAAEECFTKNDLIWANRPPLLAGKILGYNYSSMATSLHSEQWRHIRKVCSLEIFSNKRLSAFSNIRRDETDLLLRKLYSLCSVGEFRKVELRTLLTQLTINNLIRMMAGKRYYGEGENNSEEAMEFDKIFKGFLNFSGLSNPADFLPILGWIDFGGYEKMAKELSSEMDKFLQGLIDEHRSCQEDLKSKDTMIKHLLSLQLEEPNKYSDDFIKCLVQDMLIGGSETTVATIEWAMSLLLNHPEQLKKAKDEMNRQIGQNCLVDEKNISKLPFLQNIILETFRLYHPAPLLVPHYSTENCSIGGYDIPRRAMLIVNGWAIHRDPNSWDQPTEFKPERFETLNAESEMYRFKFFPFGRGRRSCPGSGLADRVVPLVLGSLIQCFDWKRVGEELIDMAEGKGLAMAKVEPLVALCKPEGIINMVL